MVPLAAGWRHLLFAHWPIATDALDERLPEPLAVQAFDGSGWLSVVAFTNVDTRFQRLSAGIGIPIGEVNLRTYVTVDGEPGVYFFSLDADSVGAVLGARVTHRLPYYYARVRLQWQNGRVNVSSRRRHPGGRPASFRATYWPTGKPFTPEPGSRAAFLTERRRVYTQSSDGSIRYTDVDHPPWTLYPAEVTVEANTLFEANGFEKPDADPVYQYCPGVDVTTTRSKPWTGSE